MSDRHPVMTTPALFDGQRLDQPTFHALYEAMPPGTWAELIDGVVYMSGPVGFEQAVARVPLTVWLAYYAEQTPGSEVLCHTSTVLGSRSELQPDSMLRILPEYGGRTRDEVQFIAGPPELLVEVSHTSLYTDLGPKLEDYERAGVREYVVRTLEPDAVHWFVLINGRFVESPPGPDGLYHSQVFPGLWLDPQALIRGDRRRLREVVALGCATPEHAEFVAKLAAIRDKAQGKDPA
jgi:Uma2 family endonuclease